jgi:uncharacterized protein YaiI (UPF0178 family)
VDSFLICDTSHVFARRGAQTITVDKGADSADFAIVSRLQPGDLVITQDYGLAAMCLTRQAKVIDQNGMRYTNDNIQELLAQRAEATRIRRGGGRLRGPQKRTGAQNEAFLAGFQAMLQEAFQDAQPS